MLRSSVPAPARSALAGRFSSSLAGRVVAGVAPALATPLLALGAQAADSAPPRRGALPVIGYAEATGLQYGATAYRVFRAGGARPTYPSSDAVYFARTGKSHTKAFAQADRWSADNRSRWRLRGEYISYPLPYYGTGPDTPNDAEEWYSAGVTTLHAFHQRAFARGTFVLLGFRRVDRTLRTTERGGLLDLGGAARAPRRVSHLQLGIIRDTRDDLSAPRRGTFVRAILSLPAGDGSAARFLRQTVDARWFIPAGAGAVVALQAQYDGAGGGSVPFDHLAMIGADTALRGYARGRFRDHRAVAAQMEVRSAYRRRIGAVTFAGIGTVAPRNAELLTARWHPAAGIGLRYLLAPPERSAARLDVAFGRRSIALNLGINEAF